MSNGAVKLDFLEWGPSENAGAFGFVWCERLREFDERLRVFMSVGCALTRVWLEVILG